MAAQPAEKTDWSAWSAISNIVLVIVTWSTACEALKASKANLDIAAAGVKVAEQSVAEASRSRAAQELQFEETLKQAQAALDLAREQLRLEHAPFLVFESEKESRVYIALTSAGVVINAQAKGPYDAPVVQNKGAGAARGVLACWTIVKVETAATGSGAAPGQWLARESCIPERDDLMVGEKSPMRWLPSVITTDRLREVRILEGYVILSASSAASPTECIQHEFTMQTHYDQQPPFVTVRFGKWARGACVGCGAVPPEGSAGNAPAPTT